MNPFKSFRTWVRKYMKALEEKEELSFKDIILSGLFRLIAKTIKVFLSISFLIKRVIDFKRKKVLKEFKSFFSQVDNKEFMIIYTDSIQDKNLSTIINHSTKPQGIVLVIKEEKNGKCELVENSILKISSKLFFKYYEELKHILSTRKGSLLISVADINGAQLLVNLNAMKYTTISSLSQYEGSMAKFIVRNSIENNSTKEEI